MQNQNIPLPVVGDGEIHLKILVKDAMHILIISRFLRYLGYSQLRYDKHLLEMLIHCTELCKYNKLTSSCWDVNSANIKENLVMVVIIVFTI